MVTFIKRYETAEAAAAADATTDGSPPTQGRYASRS